MKFYASQRFRTTVGKFADVLTGIKMRHALIGGNAVDVWANPPVTNDVDLIVEFHQAKLMKMIDELTVVHPEVVLIHRKVVSAAGLYVLYYVDKSERVRVDVIMSDHEAFRWALDGAVKVPAVGVPVVRPEDLVVTKFLAGRPKDIAAIRSIMGTRVSRLTDWSYVGKALSLLGLLDAFNRKFKTTLSARGMPRK